MAVREAFHRVLAVVEEYTGQDNGVERWGGGHVGRRNVQGPDSEVTQTWRSFAASSRSRARW